MICYAIPALIIYNRIQTPKEHEPIAEVNPFGFTANVEEQRYQTGQIAWLMKGIDENEKLNLFCYTKINSHENDQLN